MHSLRSRLRIFFFMFLLGSVTTPYLKAMYERWSEVSVDLPATESVSPIYVWPQYNDEIPRGGGGSGGYMTDEEIVTTLRNVDLQSVRIRNADFAGADIMNSDFGNADLRGADFSRAIVLYGGFLKTNLANADFSGAQLRSCELSDSVLLGGKFVRANLFHSDFSNAEVGGADFTDANLSNARLETARGMTYDQIKVAVINEFTSLPSHLVRNERPCYCSPKIGPRRCGQRCPRTKDDHILIRMIF